MVLKVVGGSLIAFGIIWLLQGLGVLRWPPASAMIAQREWALYGAMAAVVGAVIVWMSGRLRPRR